MSNSSKNRNTPPADDQTSAADASAEREGGPAEPPAPAAETAESPAPEAPSLAPDDGTARLEGEVAELKDKLLRALAEVENVRRRAAREREDTAKYAIANFAREMLTVADNLRRALDSMPAEARHSDEAMAALSAGIELTERSMLAAFERVGIKPIEALGRRFDHNLHEAMFEVEDPSRPAGTVAQVLEPGYLLGDRLLRPAKVGIVKGGPGAPEGEAGAAPAADAEGAGAAADGDSAAKAKAGAYEKRTDEAPPQGSKIDTES